MVRSADLDIQVSYVPEVQVLQSLQDVSEVQSHLLLRQVPPAHYVVQEPSLVCPEDRNKKLTSEVTAACSRCSLMARPRLRSHLQDEDVAAGGLVRVQKSDQVGVVQGLEESDLLQNLLSTQQLLVDVFSCDGAFTPSLVTPLGHGEPAPAQQRGTSCVTRQLTLGVVRFWTVLSAFVSCLCPRDNVAQVLSELPYLPSSVISV